MREGQISIYYGEGKGKTCVAVGRGLRACGDDLRVVMIQFMEYHTNKEISLLEKLEPDFRIFRFEKEREEIDESMRREIGGEIRNAFNFARKIIDTGECEMLMLDGILECVDQGYITAEELDDFMDKRPEYMDLLLTGDVLPKGISEKAHCIYQIIAEK